MPPRTDPPLKLQHSPLIFVLAQVRISPVMAIDEKIPGLQEAMRKSGYPGLSTRQTETSIQSPDGQTKSETHRQWEFINKERNASVLVGSGSLTYQVAAYDVFETFIEAMSGALALFAQHLEPTLALRIGLRYVDLVVPSEGKSIREYFSDSLRGFKIEDESNRKAFFSESVSETGANQRFTHRYVEALRGFAFPPDLLPVCLKLQRDLRMNSPFGLLDMDHSLTLNEDFSVEKSIDHLCQLHEHQTKAFRASVTDAALNEWKGL